VCVCVCVRACVRACVHAVKDFLPIFLILPATLSHGVYSASDRNEYQRWNNNVSGE
jgi:hypothetical protein